MGSITITKEDYHNIPKELLESPSTPDIDEPDVILGDAKQWKSDVEQLTKLLPGVTQHLSEHEKLAALVTFFFLLVSEGIMNR